MFQVGCEHFTVHNQDTRTTSAVEAYNGILGRSAEKMGIFFKFVRIIRDEEFFKSRHFEMLCESGGSLAKKRRRTSVEKSKKIKEASLLLQQGKITVATFLSRMVYEKNGICVNMVEEENIFKEESSDEDLFEDISEPPSYNEENVCVVCQDKSPNIVLIPCKHLKICDECNLKLQADAISKGMPNYNCPYCRKVVEDSMHVYT